MGAGKHRIASSILILGLVMAYVAIRLANLDDLVTSDEPLWLGRSANFYRALRTGEFEYTWQMAHPGVLAMWAGAAAFFVRAPEYATLVTSNLDNVRDIHAVLRHIDVDPLSMMVAAKVSKVLLQGIFFTISMVYCVRLLPFQVAVTTGLLVAFDPFLSGLDSALHVDGLFTIACFAVLLSISYAVEKTDLSTARLSAAGPWASAGLLTACAWLTRSTGIVLVGIVCFSLVLMIAADLRTRAEDFRLDLQVLSAISHAIVWLLAAGVTTLALLPALWVSPFDIMLKVMVWTAKAALEGHENPTFYRGEIFQGNPGFSFYPVSILWRTTPVTWLGLLALGLLVVWAWRNHELSGQAWRLLLSLGIFTVVYAIAMSLGAKKFDRYILPVFPVIDLFAATGFWLLYSWITTFAARTRVFTATALAALITFGQAASVLTVMPYRLDYYNPVLGGNERAQDMLQLGWGQGGKDVMNYILNHSNADRGRVLRIPRVPQAFSYFLPGDSNVQLQKLDLVTPADWYETDWFVTGIQQTQRHIDKNQHLFQTARPAHVVSVEGVPYFRIYTPSTLPLPEALRAPTACTITFGNQIRLMQITNHGNRVDLYWLTENGAKPDEVEITVRFADTGGGTHFSTSGTFDPAGSDLMSRTRLSAPADEAAPTRSARTMDITVRDASTGAILPATAPWDSRPKESGTTRSGCYSTTTTVANNRPSEPGSVHSVGDNR